MIRVRVTRQIEAQVSYAKPRRFCCPACGNTDRNTITDNGESWASPHLTFLCLAQSGPCGDPNDDPSDMTCGMQWEPNSEY